MGYHQKGFRILFKMFFQPVYRIVIDMVGRFVQDQQVNRGNQCRRQCYTFFLTAGKRFHLLFKVRNTQFGENGLCFTFQRPCFRLIHFFCQICCFFHQFFILRCFRQSRHCFFIITHQCQLRIFPAEHLLQYCCTINKQRILRQVADSHAIHSNDGTAVRLVHPCDDFQ